MSMKCVLAVCMAVGLVTCAEGSLGVQQTVTPSVIREHLTRSLTVNCSIVNVNTSDIDQAISLYIFKSTVREPTVFVDVAYVNGIDQKVQDVFKLNATLTGHISNFKEGYLAVTWDYPGLELTGNYQCQLNGLGGSFGHIHSLNTTNQVTTDDPQLNDAFVELQKHDGRIQSLEHFLEGFPDSLFSFISTPSSVFGVKYMLSKALRLNTVMASLVCKLYGGYLVEFGSNATDVTTLAMVASNGSVSNPLLVGLTDQGTEGNWTYREHKSKAVAGSFQWASGQPDGGNMENCARMEVNGQGTWQLHDVNCFDTKLLSHFLCEVPPAKDVTPIF